RSVKSHSHLISPIKPLKICLPIFLGPPCWRLSRIFCVSFSGGRISAVLTLAMSLGAGHLVLLATPSRLRFWNRTALEDNGFLVVSRFDSVQIFAN
ncbi:unnamed protein product, partial [Staurois parvus]